MDIVIYELINLMKLAETIRGGKTGQEKKDFVLKEINKKLDKLNVSEDVKDIIPAIIDIIIQVDKHNIKINPIIKRSLFCCFNI